MKKVAATPFKARAPGLRQGRVTHVPTEASARAIAQLREGRYREFDTPEEALRYLGLRR